MLAALFVCSFGKCCLEIDRRQSACVSSPGFTMESWEEHQDGYFREGEAVRTEGTRDRRSGPELRLAGSLFRASNKVPSPSLPSAPCTRDLGFKIPKRTIPLSRVWCEQPRGDGCGPLKASAPLSSGEGRFGGSEGFWVHPQSWKC